MAKSTGRFPMLTMTRRLGAVAALAAIGSQLVCACAALPENPQPAWNATPRQPAAFRPLNPAAPAPDFVPVEQGDKAFPRRMSDDIDMTMVLEVIALILAVETAPGSPKKAKPQGTPEP